MVLNGWYVCPMCGKRIQKVEGGSVIYGTPIHCRPCSVDWYPTIYMGKELDDDTPFPHKQETTE